MQIEEIYELFYDKQNHYKNRSLDDLIKLYEANRNKIESINSEFSDRLIFNYSIDLARNEEYTKAIPYLEKSISIISKSEYKNSKLNIESYSKELRLWKAVSYYYTKSLKESKSIFEELHKAYPNNDNYKNWLKSCIHFTYQKISNYLWAVAGVSFVLSIILGRFNFRILELMTLLVSILTMLIIGAIHLASKFKQRKIK